MTINRSKAREIAMIILYQIDIYKERNINFEIDKVIKENLEIDNEFVKELVYGVLENKDNLIKKANDNMIDWSIDRIDKTGAAILEIAIYELEHTETPEIVVINEAIELAKRYSDENVRKIVNGVLDKIIKG